MPPIIDGANKANAIRDYCVREGLRARAELRLLRQRSPTTRCSPWSATHRGEPRHAAALASRAPTTGPSSTYGVATNSHAPAQDASQTLLRRRRADRHHRQRLARRASCSPARTSCSRICRSARASSTRSRRSTGVPNVKAAIRYAINHPEGMRAAARAAPPGHEGHHRDRRHLAAAAADAHARRAPARCSRSCCELLADSRRRRRPHHHRHRAAPPDDRRRRCKRMVGDEDLRRLLPGPLYNHDAEDPDGMVELGTTAHGEVVEINRRAAESDLIIYVNLNFVPDGRRPQVGGDRPCGYESLQAHHNPQDDPRQPTRYMDPERSALHRSRRAHGRLDRQAPQGLPHRDRAQQPHVRRAARRSSRRTRTTSPSSTG